MELAAVFNVDCYFVDLKPAFSSINLMDINRFMTSFSTVLSFVADVFIAVLSYHIKTDAKFFGKNRHIKNVNK